MLKLLDNLKPREFHKQLFHSNLIKPHRGLSVLTLTVNAENLAMPEPLVNDFRAYCDVVELLSRSLATRGGGNSGTRPRSPWHVHGRTRHRQNRGRYGTATSTAGGRAAERTAGKIAE